MQQLADNFWTFRGDFKVARVINLGTHMSLVRRANGRFLLLDSYDLDGGDLDALLSLTDGGRAIEAVINVHPFHTLHCTAIHALLPHARLFGTRRHHEQVTDLPWEPGFIEDRATQEVFAGDLGFSVPQGIDFVCEDDSVHVASVLVRDRQSSIVHVDDTINVLAAPGLLGKLLPQSKLKFHPQLSKALEKRAGAADDYAQWAESIANAWAGTPVVCAAHSSIRKLPQDGWRNEIGEALAAVETTLSRHRSEHG
ncbi:hypothetical protein [Martelella endophytica]|uniref:Metallo-beta-lactamase domain-containing protein n=1 Tax=Martelella endophytica TaxID=1486262 RepID=A0A0D5LWJ5_MAREN|nr:hypothetical protein [Martelella endophytica]AJY47788.1 hypothetical protein TM49_22280 [Martelella endophytica]